MLVFMNMCMQAFSALSACSSVYDMCVRVYVISVHTPVFFFSGGALSLCVSVSVSVSLSLSVAAFSNT